VFACGARYGLVLFFANAQYGARGKTEQVQRRTDNADNRVKHYFHAPLLAIQRHFQNQLAYFFIFFAIFSVGVSTKSVSSCFGALPFIGDTVAIHIAIHSAPPSTPL
jgi:hypothetical protein